MAKLFFKKAVIAGLIAGAVFMMLEMIMVPLFMGGSPWGHSDDCRYYIGKKCFANAAPACNI